MMYLPGLFLATALGYVCILRLRTGKQLSGILLWLMSMALGLGLAGFITFFSHLFFGWHSPWAPSLTAGALLALLVTFTPKIKIEPIDLQKNLPGLLLLGVIAVFMFLEAKYYPLGGWDAWSCWNLKAKFIYLGRESWKDMFDPLLWRSNTQYPLLLPCINVWFWDLIGDAPPWVPMINSVLLTVLAAGILLFGLEKLGSAPYFRDKKIINGNRTLTPILTAAVFLVPFNVTLGASQYSDIVFGLFLLSALVCLFMDEFVLSGIFLGLLSFTKTEGTVAAVLLGLLICVKHRKSIPSFLPALGIAALPTMCFTWMMAPPNEAFINGLMSTEKPSTWARLQTVLAFPFFELISLKWNGIWILLLIGLASCWKNSLRGKLQILALFFIGYFAVLLAYYQINTFFDIGWWMQNTLNRILFALLPSLALWLGLAL